MFTDATFGRGGGNALVLEGPRLGEVHGRFMHYRSQFWIETLSGAEPIRVNGSPLKPGEIVPLVEGQTVQIGEIEYRTLLRRA